MATLSEQIVIIVGWLNSRHPGAGFGEQCAKEMEQMIRHSMGGERVYIPEPDTSKRDAVERAIRTLPAAVVAERLGVTAHYARKIQRSGVKKRN